jgi:type VI secretion system protein ImpD
MTCTNSLESVTARLIVHIDRLVSAQLDEILHHPALQELEAAWRGLHLLVSEAGTQTNVKVRLLDIEWREIEKDLGRALEFDQTRLFELIYTEEYDLAGGFPFGFLIANFSFSHQRADHLDTLKKLSQIAGAAFSPVCTSLSPAFFGVKNFSDLHSGINYQNLFSSPEYFYWKNFRQLEDTRFMSFALPKVLIRQPWGSFNTSGKLFYKEQCFSEADFLWANAAFALGAVLIREFAQVGWFAHIRGAPRDTIAGGIVTQLSTIEEESTSAWLSALPSTDLVITEALEKEFSERGIISLCHLWNTPYAAFFSLPTCHQPQNYTDQKAGNNARISAQLPNILCASRFAHYIKIIMRDKVGSFMSAPECERFLESWLLKYSINSGDLDWSTQARYPLQSVNVSVTEDRLKPGHYKCVIHLTPHYQLDGAVSEIRLTTEIVNQSKAA